MTRPVPQHGDEASPAYALQIIRSLASGVIAVDGTGRILAANPASAQHLRLTEDQLAPGVSLSDIEVLQPLQNVFDEVRDGQQGVSRRELLIALPEGKEVELGLSATLLEGSDAFNGVIFLFTDMTERRALERAAELNRQLADLGELTAGVVHELRTPVMVISGMAELLVRRLGESHPNVETARLIHDESGNLDRLISQFLGFARPFDLQLERCAPEEVAERAVKLCGVKASQRKVQLHLDVEEELPPITADTGKLVQVLVNLINNAVDAVESGSGKVWLKVWRDRGDTVFEVTDNGPGLNIDSGEDVFKPFFTKKEGGTGLGLSIVSRIVHAHKGTVSAGNRSEGGARFEVRIALRPGASA